MSDLFDTSRVKDDEEYWNALATRVTAAAVSGRARTPALLRVAASRSSWIAASLMVATAAAAVFVLHAMSGIRANWDESLQPTDEVGRSITESTQPPSIGALLIETGWSTPGGIH